MNIELSEQDLKLIRTSLERFYAKLCDEKKLVKEKIAKHPKGSLFDDIGNFQESLKDINEQLSSILKLENRVFIQNNTPVINTKKKGV